jgi:predicted DCC family thiol-disulfide oxidoreductase YuxK
VAQGDDIFLIYDKQCPACDFYCNLVRIRESVGRLVLIDAREPSELMDEITAAGLDIDQGMVLTVGSTLHYGSDAIHVLSLMSTRSGVFNRLSYWCFHSERVSAFLYPIFRAWRNLLLKALRKNKINNLDIADNDSF